MGSRYEAGVDGEVAVAGEGGSDVRDDGVVGVGAQTAEDI